jgi:hypothetical protein
MPPWIAFLLRLAMAAPLAWSSVAPDHAPVSRPPATASTHHLMRGADISWPNCPAGLGIPHRPTLGQPMPGAAARFVVVGLTNGPGFHPNPCLASQVRQIADDSPQLGAYAMTTYPTERDITVFGGTGPYPAQTAGGRLRNAADAEATFNINSMLALRMRVPMVWVDVEPYADWPWSGDHHANRAVIRAVIRRYREAGYRVGIYTYLSGWQSVVGGWQLPNLPTWVPVGAATRQAAKQACGIGPSGGQAWLTQWHDSTRDYDLLCPGAPAVRTMFS